MSDFQIWRISADIRRDNFCAVLEPYLGQTAAVEGVTSLLDVLGDSDTVQCKGLSKSRSSHLLQVFGEMNSLQSGTPVEGVAAYLNYGIGDIDASQARTVPECTVLDLVQSIGQIDLTK